MNKKKSTFTGLLIQLRIATSIAYCQILKKKLEDDEEWIDSERKKKR